MGFGRTVDLDLIRKKNGYLGNCRFGMIRKIMGFGQTVDLDMIRQKMGAERSLDLEFVKKNYGY